MKNTQGKALMLTTALYVNAGQGNQVNAHIMKKHDAEEIVTISSRMVECVWMATTALYVNVHQETHALLMEERAILSATTVAWIMGPVSMNKGVENVNVDPGNQVHAAKLTQSSVMQDVSPQGELEFKAWIPRLDAQPVNADAGKQYSNCNGLALPE